jgi:hypothetical protein
VPVIDYPALESRCPGKKKRVRGYVLEEPTYIRRLGVSLLFPSRGQSENHGKLEHRYACEITHDRSNAVRVRCPPTST